jgi:tellurite resistance protein TerC
MDVLMIAILGKPLWMWALFLGIVLALLVFDLGVLNREDHEIGVAESLRLSALYITLGWPFPASSGRRSGPRGRSSI